MRIRSTKPEFWRSRRIADVDWETRFVLKGLESYVDDNGVGKDDLELIVGDIFSRDLVREPSRTLKRVQVAVDTLFSVGLIHRYEVDGTDLLYISWWESIQYINRPSKGRFRRPDGTLEYGESEIGGSLLNTQEPSSNPRAGTGEQGNRGTGEQTLSSDESDQADEPAPSDDRFEEFWETYAKKVGRKKAEQKWKLALKKPGVTADLLIASAAAYVEWQRREGKHPEFTKDPTTWLNGEHWTDEAVGRSAPASPIRHIPLASELELPPDGLSPAEYAEWDRAQRARRHA
jgi:hypothetical protein